MRSGFSGLALASVLLLSSSLAACGESEPAAPAAPAGLALSTGESAHGILPAQTAQIKTKGSDATVSMTPNWRVGGRQLNIMWYAGASQTKRFFVVTEKGVAADQPAYLANPELGVRMVRVSFDGAAPVALKPTLARAPFDVPAGAKAVTRVEIDYGASEAPQTVVWK
ncbi:hypothetical protein [Phenylobacterium sp.]|uniref:hypothetical protein n=1 Tax=Phenylobacterium sp. TaxID=1871053 RepID=UPI0030F4071A